jgi:hypothetical protein
MAVFFAEAGDVRGGASKIRKPGSPTMATRAEPHGFPDSLVTVNRAAVWGPATGAVQATLTGHNSWVAGVAFSPDGQQLASTSTDQTVQLSGPNSMEAGKHPSARRANPGTRVEPERDRPSRGGVCHPSEKESGLRYPARPAKLENLPPAHHAARIPAEGHEER